MTSRRALLIFAETTDAMEELQWALQMIEAAPFKPVPEGANHATFDQQHYSDSEVDSHVVKLLRRCVPALNFGGSVIVP